MMAEVVITAGSGSEMGVGEISRRICKIGIAKIWISKIGIYQIRIEEIGIEDIGIYKLRIIVDRCIIIKIHVCRYRPYSDLVQRYCCRC